MSAQELFRLLYNIFWTSVSIIIAGEIFCARWVLWEPQLLCGHDKNNFCGAAFKRAICMIYLVCYTGSADFRPLFKIPLAPTPYSLFELSSKVQSNCIQYSRCSIMRTKVRLLGDVFQVTILDPPKNFFRGEWCHLHVYVDLYLCVDRQTVIG